MTYFENYLRKQNFQPNIRILPSDDTGIIVIIPCYNEPDIISTLESLWCCDRPTQAIEVICVVNAPENNPQQIIDQNKFSSSAISHWSTAHRDSKFQCYAIDAVNLPIKFAGVGLARKIGMDEAIYRFFLNKKEHGLICSMDADSVVDDNYFKEITHHFASNPGCPGASIYFEHPVDNLIDKRNQKGIIQYETHLRYLIQCMRYTGFPYAFHTVGSSFVVKASAYVKQGGMNRFKAGEDFYFLNKIIPLGNYADITTTRVIPSSRVSNRVPFGTGSSMTKWGQSDDTDFLTYSFASFLPLRDFFSKTGQIYHEKRPDMQWVQSRILLQFLRDLKAESAIQQALENSSSFETFSKRFYTWFDAFQIVKYLNYSAINHTPKHSIRMEACELLKNIDRKIEYRSDFELLKIFRNLDKQA